MLVRNPVQMTTIATTTPVNPAAHQRSMQPKKPLKSFEDLDISLVSGQNEGKETVTQTDEQPDFTMLESNRIWSGAPDIGYSNLSPVKEVTVPKAVLAASIVKIVGTPRPDTRGLIEQINAGTEGADNLLAGKLAKVETTTIPWEVAYLIEAIARKTKLVEDMPEGGFIQGPNGEEADAEMKAKNKAWHQLVFGHVFRAQVFRVIDVPSLTLFVMSLKKTKFATIEHPAERGQRLIMFKIPTEYVAVTPWVSLLYLATKGLLDQVDLHFKPAVAGQKKYPEVFATAKEIPPQPTGVVTFVVDAKTGVLTRWFAGYDKRAIKFGSINDVMVACNNTAGLKEE